MDLYGNTTGLSPAVKKKLERIYRRRVPLDCISTPELTRSLVEGSLESRRQIGVLIHRSGEIDYVIVGSATKLMLPDIGRLRSAEGRFRGLRLVHTHLYHEPLSRDDIIDLVRLRLDLVAAIQIASSGEARSMTYAYNTPLSRTDGKSQAGYQEIGPIPLGQVKVHVGSLMADLESEFARYSALHRVQAREGRAILVHVAEKNRPEAWRRAEEGMCELRELAYTAGTEVVDEVIQMRECLDPQLVIGKGKLEDIILRAMELDVCTLLFDHNLTPAQATALSRMTDLKIIDRTQLILDIFAQRAESRDGKLQVELAQLKYSLPRLSQRDDSLSRLTGGIGGRGPGETKLEIGKRRAKERIAYLEDQLRQLAKQRAQRRHKRERSCVPALAIVGYTNAGKSTFLNTLTGAQVLAENKLFATLDTRSRQVEIEGVGQSKEKVIITDTVGFIRNLPPDLFAAFRATFEETAIASVLLHLVDASALAYEEHMAVAEQVFEKLGIESIPRLLVFNKVDLISDLVSTAIQQRYPEALMINARDPVSAKSVLSRMTHFVL
ncbi:GTPase HflX [Pajaroellobacter abortibovis]|uniref:GTPase HflX n=1 Tax=Pajaroellobacter abortibovis TaxID=1882918 RepID=A0A1L6MVQ7_9BACT|nr:GTPase HflX [Pajaroellobacter abortibovis]